MGTIVRHGSYGTESKYEVIQHNYICTDCEDSVQGFAEVLEIKNPPLGKSGNVIHIFWGGIGETYFEFEKLRDAIGAYETTKSLFRSSGMEKVLVAIARKPGYISTGPSLHNRPWFYEA